MLEYKSSKNAEIKEHDTPITFDYKGIVLIDIKEKWLHATEKSESFCLFAVERGSFRLWTSAGTVTLEAGDAVILPPLAKIRSASSSEEGIRFFEASFNINKLCFDTMSLYKLKSSHSVFKNLESLYRCKHNEDRIFKDALLFSVLAQIVQCPNSAPDKESELVNRIYRIVEENIDKELDVDFLADTLSLDRSHISRIFSKATGKTVKAYINEKRVTYACELLESSSFNIGKIAELTGFGDSNLFTKFFSYHTGKTPSNYRRGLHGISPRVQKR